jgi:hypothetical protein
MKIEDWLQWPTRSADPATNAAIAVFLGVIIIITFVLGATILLPIVIVIGIAKGVQWYMNRPVPTDQLYAVTQQRSVSANFPDTEKFMDAHLDRFYEAIHDDLPAFSIYLTMARITEPLYEEEDLNNPLPPLPPLLTVNEIEEGRFRDRLLAHQRKSVDAPRTLEVFNATLSACYRKLIAALPPIAKSTPAEFAKSDKVESFATLPLIDLMPNVGKTVMSMLRPFFNDEVEEIGLFASLRKQIDWNFREASGLDDRPNSKYISADKYKGTPQHISETRRSRPCFKHPFPSRSVTRTDSSIRILSAGPDMARRNSFSILFSTTFSENIPRRSS